MNIKKVAEKLAEIRDNAKDNGTLSEEDKIELKSLVGDTITMAQTDLKKLTRPEAHNDNKELSADQTFRLRLIEKTGTGSKSIH